MDRQTIESLLMPITYGRHLIRLFPAEKLLDGTGLCASDLEDPDGRISVQQALQYVRNTLALAEQPDWYLDWAKTLTDHFHGPTSIALVSAPSLGDGIDAFVRYFPSRVPYLHLQSREHDERFVVEFCPLIELDECEPMLIETLMIILQQHFETVYDVDFSAAALRLNYSATPYADKYCEHFHCPVSFDAGSNALVFPIGWRGLKNFGYVKSTWEHACAQCAATMASSRSRETLGQIKNYLCQAFERKNRGRPLPKLTEVAEFLHLTPRTLIRRLREMGLTYQEITDDFLRTRAQELLANDELTVKQVANLLGFDNPANFGKAFKRWHGVSPGVYRAR